MAIDPICGMQVDPAKAAGETHYGGKTYYFCSPGCKATFDANPEKYIGGEETSHEHGQHSHHDHH